MPASQIDISKHQFARNKKIFLLLLLLTCRLQKRTTNFYNLVF